MNGKILNTSLVRKKRKKKQNARLKYENITIEKGNDIKIEKEYRHIAHFIFAYSSSSVFTLKKRENSSTTSLLLIHTSSD